MAVNLSPVGGVAAQFFDNSGQVLTGGKLYTYLAGTTTSAATYTTNSGLTANSNPIVLNAAGRVADSGEIWLSDSVNYKFVLQDQNSVQIAVWDNVTGINSNFLSYTLQEQTFTATQGQTVFTLTGGLQYTTATNNLAVFVNGSKQIAATNYIETSTTVFTFVTGLNVGDVVDAVISIPVATNVTNAVNVAYNPPFTSSVATNVQAKLAQTVSVMDFGAVGDGVTDDTAAIQAAITSLTNGGTIFFPTGNYVVATTLNLNSKTGIKFLGTAPENTSATKGSYLTLTASSGSRIIDARSSQGFSIESLGIVQTNSGFTGYVIDLSHGTSGLDSSYFNTYNCSFSATASTSIINLSLAIIVSIQACSFNGGLYQIVNNGSYSNVINITECTFQQYYNTPIYLSTGFPIAWNIIGCTFEQNNNSSVAALKIVAVVDGLTYLGNWHGDGNTTGTWINVSGSISSGTIQNNFFSTGNSGIVFTGSGASVGLNIENNTFSTLTTAVSYSGSSGGVYGDYCNNFIYTVTNTILGSPTIGRYQTQNVDSNRFAGTTILSNSAANGVGSTVSGTIFTVTSPSTASVAYRVQVPSTAGQFATIWNITGGSNIAYVLDNGNIANANNSYGAISDIKIKENIVDASPKLNKLLNVKVRQYNLKDNASLNQIGVIAQELETVFPSMVEEIKDIDADGNDLGTTTKTVKYSVFVPILIKAIQEQQEIIEQLKGKVGL